METEYQIYMVRLPFCGYTRRIYAMYRNFMSLHLIYVHKIYIMQLYISEQQEDLQGQYDLSWNCKYCQYSNTVNSVSGEKISVHPDMHSDPWSYEFSQGLQLTKFDPHDKYDTGKYVCRAVPKQSDLTGPKTEALTAEIHINIISGK